MSVSSYYRNQNDRRETALRAFVSGKHGFVPGSGKAKHPRGSYTRILTLRFIELRAIEADAGTANLKAPMIMDRPV